MKFETNEQLLITSVLSHDRKAFETLVNQYKGLVYHIVFPLVKIEADRQDLCQDIFLKIYEKLYTFQFRSRLSTWIGNIAFNTTVNFLKKKRLILSLDTIIDEDDKNNYEDLKNQIIDETPIIESKLIFEEKTMFLKREIEKLKPIEKTLLLLFHKDGLSLKDISEVIEMPLNTVKSHLFRARTVLKEELLKTKFLEE